VVTVSTKTRKVPDFQSYRSTRCGSSSVFKR